MIFGQFIPKVQSILNMSSNGQERTLSIVNETASRLILLYDAITTIQDFPGPKLIVLPDEEMAEEYVELFKGWGLNAFFYQGIEAGPYDAQFFSETEMAQRFRAITSALNEENAFIVTDIKSALLKGPSPDFFEQRIKIEKEQIISPYELAKTLVDMGYRSLSTAEEPGSFVHRGEVFDVFPLEGSPLRINYFDDLIESIRPIDLETQRTIKTDSLDFFFVDQHPYSLCQRKFSTLLREQLEPPGNQEKLRHQRRKELIEDFQNGIPPREFPLLIPLLFEKPYCLLDFFDHKQIWILKKDICTKNYELFAEKCQEKYQELASDLSSDQLLIPFNRIFAQLNHFLEVAPMVVSVAHNSEPSLDEIDLQVESLTSFKNNIPKLRDIKNLNANLVTLIINNSPSKLNHIYFYISSNQLSTTFKENLSREIDPEIFHKVVFKNTVIKESFYLPNEKTLVISQEDLWRKSGIKENVQSSLDRDIFAEQISSLKPNDYVIHSVHGVGQYEGMKLMSSAGIEGEFISILFKNDDRVFVPVHKFDLIQKYADSTSKVVVEDLRKNKFSEIKLKARQSAKRLAFDLIKLHAKRHSRQAFSFSPNGDYFEEMERSFPFKETFDQQRAIDDVCRNMESSVPMDRLVCGDVGFGKTEVAIRAAFKAVIDHKQVAVLVPTTILALQHFTTFTKRLSQFPINIDFLSRFKSAKEEKIILQKLEQGEIDIIIGTHKLLSEKINFKDLGLVVVDEEQRFGVNHKETLKSLKETVDFLTLTATPIPRTLQLSFLGLKDISVIKTPPANRQSIKSLLVQDDDYIIRDALEAELSRGGQVFCVNDRIQNLESISLRLKKLAPKAKIVIAHGQLPEKQLEVKIKDFYDGKYNILLSTTIIESGIDIPNANTLIVFNSHHFGLSQLHQLRGRIGRSERKAYAYFISPKNLSTSDVAFKRLQALINHHQLGSGFAIASSDMEIRGSGNIIGAEQSGHIESIGLELFLDLVKEEVAKLKGEVSQSIDDIDIQTGEVSRISPKFMPSEIDRLKYYKKISSLKSHLEADALKGEITDLYGPIPNELENLFFSMECRLILNKTGVEKASFKKSKIFLQFNEDYLAQNVLLRDKLFNYLIAHPTIFKLLPKSRVECEMSKIVDKNDFKALLQRIAGQILQ